MSVRPSEDDHWLATAHVVAYVNRAHGTDFVLEHRLQGGYQNGAYALRSAGSGSRAVLKWSTLKNRAGLVRRAAPVVAAARAAGWPTPAWLAVGATPGGYPYQVQEFAEGGHSEFVTRRLARAVLPVLDVQAGMRPETVHDWSAYDHRVVFADESAFSSTLEACSAAGAEFVKALRSWTEPHRHVELPTTDLVHGDLNPGNVFLAGDRIGALVDAEALGKGSRFHDLATLLAFAELWDSERGASEVLLAYAQDHAAPGELELSLASSLLGILAFVAERNPGGTDDVLRKATELIARH